MHIGIDFDNTIADYDRLFADLAVEAGHLAVRPEGGKRVIRDLVRSRDDGEIAWQKLQALAFGPRIGDAVMMEGFATFVAQCRSRDVAVFVVSHKTRRATLWGLVAKCRRHWNYWMTLSIAYSKGWPNKIG